LPLAMPLLIAAPVVLSFRGELARVIRPCLSSRQRFRDSQHILARETQLVTVLIHIVAEICGYVGRYCRNIFRLMIDKTPMDIGYFCLTQSY